MKQLFIEQSLKSIDTLGYFLHKTGINKNVNRHTVAAVALTKYNSIQAHKERVEMKVRMNSRKVLNHSLVKKIVNK